MTIAAAEANQVAWLVASSRATGGEAWEDGPLRWARPGHGVDAHLLFPRELPVERIVRGVARARDLGARSVGCWLSPNVDGAALADAGFCQGWAPHWMAAPADSVGEPDDPRVALEDDTPEYEGPVAGLLSLAGRRSWHAVARIDGALAGRAWAHRGGDVAGLYDVDVWPPFRRRGLGAALTRAVCAAARAAGARTITLNATPDGQRLYAALGFQTLGEGATWWRHE